MEANAAARAAHSEMEPLSTMEQCRQSAADRFTAAADEFKRALAKEMAASAYAKEPTAVGTKLANLTDGEDEMERCGREMEASIRRVMAAFGRGGSIDDARDARSDTTSSVDGDNYSVDESNNGDDVSTTERDTERTARRALEFDDTPRSVLVSTLKRENTSLLAKIKLLEKSMENNEVGIVLKAELWANRIRKAEANAAQAIASQRAMEVECGAERTRVEHLRATISELNARLTTAEQATCRARMATVLMEAKHAYEAKMAAADKTPAVSNDEGRVDVRPQSDQAISRGVARSFDDTSSQADQDARSQSSSGSDGTRPRTRSGSLLRSPTQYKPRKCSRPRCHANSSEDVHEACTDAFNSPRTRRTSLHFSPTKTNTPEDRGSRPVRPRSEPPVDLRSTQRPRWKR